jgi:hypothetical protein
MLKWNKDKNKFDIIRRNKTSRYSQQPDQLEWFCWFGTGVAFFILLLTLTMCIRN